MSSINASFTDFQFNRNTTAIYDRSANNLPRNPKKNAITDGLYASSESLSGKYMSMDYTNKDGDKVHIEMASLQLQKNMAIVPVKNEQGSFISEDDLKEIMDNAKDSFLMLKKEIIKKFVEANGGEYNDVEETSYDEEEVSKLEANMPEYWNAENTSQRIVDFATSFFGAFSEKSENSEEFLETIKGAIKDGFSMAHDEMGELPGSVGGLINKTHDLIMEKLDKWFEDISSPKEDVNAAV